MGSGRRRDFEDFNARLERHIERLPEYAQKAQGKLQKYFPRGTPEQGRPAASRPQAPKVPPVRGAMPSVQQVAGEIPIVAAAQAKWARWNEPAARLERRKRRTSRALTLWVVLTVLCLLFAVAAGAGYVAEASTVVVAFAGGAVVTGALGVRSGVRLNQLKKTVLPVSTAPPPLPPSGSAAREPMERLRESEASLAELLRQLEAPSTAGTTPVPPVSVADARATAESAAVALRSLTGRIQAVERARAATPAGERGVLDTAVRTLREQLDDGLEGYGSLVAAAANAVAASGGGVAAAKESLRDATDHLAGLALALRELS